MDDKRAGVDIADRINQTHHSPSTAEVEPRKTVAERIEMEERISSQYVLTVAEQPLVEFALLVKSGM
jgi:hypothetical protein